jgi:undecaprenol kinase
MKKNDVDGFIFSLRNAALGIKIAFITQKNLRFHLLAAGIVLFAGLMLRITKFEWLILLITIFVVVITEMINTSIEFTVDLCSNEYSKQAKKAKDVSAAGVLISAIFAILVGGIIFIPKVIEFLSSLKIIF